MVLDLGRGYSRYEGLPIASGDQVLVARRSSFNLLRDVVYPLASLTAAVAAALAYRRNRGGGQCLSTSPTMLAPLPARVRDQETWGGPWARAARPTRLPA